MHEYKLFLTFLNQSSRENKNEALKQVAINPPFFKLIILEKKAHNITLITVYSAIKICNTH